jgi:hypothetical protein
MQVQSSMVAFSEYLRTREHVPACALKMAPNAHMRKFHCLICIFADSQTINRYEHGAKLVCST